jgi:hypothetical protein
VRTPTDALCVSDLGSIVDLEVPRSSRGGGTNILLAFPCIPRRSVGTPWEGHVSTPFFPRKATRSRATSDVFASDPRE